MPKLIETVSEGARTLDMIRPNWFTMVREPLILSNPERCILAQVFGGWFQGMYVLEMQFSYLAYGNGVFADQVFVDQWRAEIFDRKAKLIKR